MKRKICMTIWYEVNEALPKKSGVYLCNDGYEVIATPYSANHKAFGVTDNMPADKVEWCKLHPYEWAEIPDFVETVSECVAYELLTSVEHNVNLGIDYLTEATKTLALITKGDEN